MASLNKYISDRNFWKTPPNQVQFLFLMSRKKTPPDQEGLSEDNKLLLRGVRVSLLIYDEIHSILQVLTVHLLAQILVDKIRNDIGTMYEQLSRGDLLKRVQQLHNLDELEPQGLRPGSRTYRYEEHRASFRRLIHTLENKYRAQWLADGIPVRTNPWELEIDFLVFAYHSGTGSRAIISPQGAQLGSRIDEDFMTLVSATTLTVATKREPNIIVVGAITTSELDANNYSTKRKLGQLERVLLFLCIHYNIKPDRLFPFIHSMKRLRYPPRAFRNMLVGGSGGFESHPLCVYFMAILVCIMRSIVTLSSFRPLVAQDGAEHTKNRRLLTSAFKSDG
ncbi:hypothetical protein DFJ77DRAFT_539029 [Powellomyces hirtus]|nr:hypothetical protein DFJ77DRAFT_539029 [Powellomyces hirtus]